MQTIQPPATAPPAAPAAAPQPTDPVRSRSALGRLVLSLVLFAVGVVALIDVAGARVPVSGYLAVALVVVAAGLVVGAWHGRARGLIAVGAVLSVLLVITATAEGWSRTGTSQWVTWQPTGVEQLQTTYRINVGNAVLDLSRLNFTGRTASVDVHVSAGNLDIVLPPAVDVEIGSTVEIGNATILGQRWSGIGQPRRTVTDNGVDGPGGGQLTIDATVNVGNLEVRR